MKRILLRRFIIYSFTILVVALSVFSVQKEKNFEESWEKRFNNLQPPEKIMDAIGLKPGMVIGDIGAGRGRFTVWFADRVKETGIVYANDIDMSALLHLAKRCKQLGFENVIVRLGEVEEPNLPEGVLDIAFMINVYHHLERPVGLIRNLIPTLKPDGILVIVENDTKKSGYTSEGTPKKVLIKQVKKAGFELVKIETFLPVDNIYFFRPKK